MLKSEQVLYIPAENLTAELEIPYRAQLVPARSFLVNWDYSDECACTCLTSILSICAR